MVISKQGFLFKGRSDEKDMFVRRRKASRRKVEDGSSLGESVERTNEIVTFYHEYPCRKDVGRTVNTKRMTSPWMVNTSSSAQYTALVVVTSSVFNVLLKSAPFCPTRRGMKRRLPCFNVKPSYGRPSRYLVIPHPPLNGELNFSIIVSSRMDRKPLISSLNSKLLIAMSQVRVALGNHSPFCSSHDATLAATSWVFF